MTNAFVGAENRCPYAKEYKMKPLERTADAYVLKPHKLKPALGPLNTKVHYRVVKLSEDKKVGTICGHMHQLEAGELKVTDVDFSLFGEGIYVGDIVAYAAEDVLFQRPSITHRFHQRHQHPAHLVAPEEK